MRPTASSIKKDQPNLGQARVVHLLNQLRIALSAQHFCSVHNSTIMSAHDRALNTFYSPYHTVEAIQHASFADFIPVPVTCRNNNAVHPVSAVWLQQELIPRERDTVRAHVVSLLSNTRDLNRNFAEALQLTLDNLNSIDPSAMPTTPSSNLPNPTTVYGQNTQAGRYNHSTVSGQPSSRESQPPFEN